jgi:septum formation inhibitor-activating ATPase MinD
VRLAWLWYQGGAHQTLSPDVSSLLLPNRDADRVAGLLEANGIYNAKLLVNRVRPDMIQKNDMMSVKDVQVGVTCRLRGVCGPWG